MLYSYVPSAVKCRVFGVELVGLSKDTIVTIERLESINTFRKAQDGSQTAFVDSYGSYRVTFNIEQVSQSNDFLHTVMKLHERSGSNLKIPISVSEEISYGGTQFQATECFFETEPSTEFLSESTARQWSFICHGASFQVRGTNKTSWLSASLSATIRLIELSELAGIDLTNVETMIEDGINQAEQKLKELF